MKNFTESINRNFNKFLNSRTENNIVVLICVLIVAILIFLLGIMVGFRKASYERAWGEHYYENFGMRGGMQGVLDSDDLPNSHGAVGRIIRTDLPNVIIQDDKNNIEKVISITDDTQIKKGPTNITSAELSNNDFLIVIGQPDEQGIIESRFIRVMPAPQFIK